MQPERIKLHDLRANISDLARRVMRTRQPVVLTIHGKDIVKIVPLDEGTENIRERFPELFAK